MSTVRFAARLLLLGIALLVALPLHLGSRALRIPSPWPRLFLGSVARICGVIVRTQGRRLKRDVFYVANHVSWIDIPIISGPTGAAFVAQSLMADWPLIGWLSKLNHTVFVSRTDRMTVGNQIDELRAALEEHQPVVIFPEGTTTDGHSLLPFKKSLFEVVVPPPRPMMVQPVLIDFGAVGPEIAWIGEETFADNAVRLLSRRGTFPVRLKFLEPFDPGIHPDRKAIADEARNRIAAALSASLGGIAIV